jgi:hypothetical protein
MNGKVTAAHMQQEPTGSGNDTSRARHASALSPAAKQVRPVILPPIGVGIITRAREPRTAGVALLVAMAVGSDGEAARRQLRTVTRVPTGAQSNS